MAVLDTAIDGAVLPPSMTERLREQLAQQAWIWFWEHHNRVVIRRRILFFSLEVRLADFRWAMVELFGESPSGLGA